MQTKEAKINTEEKEKKAFPIGFFDPDLAALLAHLEPTKKIAIHCVLYIQALDRVSPCNAVGERAISVSEMQKNYLPFLTYKKIRKAKEQLAKVGILKKRRDRKAYKGCLQKISNHQILKIALSLKRKNKYENDIGGI